MRPTLWVARPCLLALALGCGLSLPGLARAQNASTAGAMELYPTLNAVGVRLAYTGDANGNATAHLEWRTVGSGAWTRGVQMNRITNQRWAGSVLWLLPGRSYDVKAVIDDPDGASQATGTVTTRSEGFPAPVGRVIHVAIGGNDGNPGTSTSPLATLQVAVGQAQPGDEIVVGPGIYYQTVDLDHPGTAGALIHLVAGGPGVILDGSDPAYLSRSDWRNDGGGIYSLPFAGVTRLVSVDSLQRLFHVASLSALQGNTSGLGQGWVIESGRLWLQLEGGVSPVGHLVHVARYDIGVRMEADYWRVAGFEVRCFGTLFPDFDYVSGGITLIGARHCIVSDCHVHLIGGRNIFLRSRAADDRIENNLVRDPRIGGWPWSVVKGTPDQELTAISNRAGRGNVIRYNTIIGTFNGVDGRLQEVGTDEDVAADCDVHDNRIQQIGDDGLETDEVSGINVRVWRNRMDNVFTGFSIAPVYQGPEYILYNTVDLYTHGAFKPSNSGTGHVWLCHNTCYGTTSGEPALHPGGPFGNDHYRNNIIVSTGAPVVSVDPAYILPGNDFDGDVLQKANGTTFFKWNGVSYSSIALLRQDTGFELVGINADPKFVSAAAGDLRIQASSPAVDAAIRLPGINDYYLGAAPDVGAYEFGGPVAIGDAPPWTKVRLDAARPNPARGNTSVPFATPREARVVCRVYDLGGRLVRELVDGLLPAGEHALPWDGRDGRGQAQPAGVYLIRLEALGERRSTRLLLLR